MTSHDRDASATEPRPPLRLLFVCTGNSARSILGEHLLRRRAEGRFEVESAGSEPTGEVHPRALGTLARRGIDASGARSKGFGRFADRPFDVVITVCDHARDRCPRFPGGGLRLHWGLEDPARAVGSAAEIAAFEATADALESHIDALLALELTDTPRDRWAERIAARDAARYDDG